LSAVQHPLVLHSCKQSYTTFGTRQDSTPLRKATSPNVRLPYVSGAMGGLWPLARDERFIDPDFLFTSRAGRAMSRAVFTASSLSTKGHRAFITHLHVSASCLLSLTNALTGNTGRRLMTSFLISAAWSLSGLQVVF